MKYLAIPLVKTTLTDTISQCCQHDDHVSFVTISTNWWHVTTHISVLFCMSSWWSRHKYRDTASSL